MMSYIYKDAVVLEHLSRSADTMFQLSISPLIPNQICVLGAQIVHSITQGGRLYVFGNGGSAADAQHFCAELTGRLLPNGRRGLPAHALTADPVFLTAWANDAGYAEVFDRLVRACVRPDDVVIGISTSGGSWNVLKGLITAKTPCGATTVLLTGPDYEQTGPIDYVIKAPGVTTALVQQSHGAILHALAGAVDAAFVES